MGMEIAELCLLALLARCSLEKEMLLLVTYTILCVHECCLLRHFVSNIKFQKNSRRGLNDMGHNAYLFYYVQNRVGIYKVG